jgi:hypothetical protein
VLFVHIAVQRILINLRELILVVVLQQRRGIRMYFRRLAIEDNFSRQLSLPGVEILLFLELGHGNHFSG